MAKKNDDDLNQLRILIHRIAVDSRSKGESPGEFMDRLRALHDELDTLVVGIDAINLVLSGDVL